MTDLKISRPTAEELDDLQAKALLDSTNWYHQFELRPGLATPGGSYIDPVSAADALDIPADLTGQRALDIGAWDGPITFELERRGATAYALDIQDPSRVGFNTARQIIGSQAVHYQGSVYDLPHHDLNELDLVVFRGVYYHLKHPILAFERINAALKLGGTLYFEGEGLLRYVENISGEPVSLNMKAILKSDVPICLFYPNNFKDSSNWFIPTPAGLRSFLIAAGFEIVELSSWMGKDSTSQRLFGRAIKVRDHDLTEHPFY